MTLTPAGADHTATRSAEANQAPEKAAVGNRDGVGLLGLFILALFLIPARFVIGPLGAAGTVSGLVALIALGRWGLGRMMKASPLADGFQPIRTAILLFGWCMAASYCMAQLRPLTGVESRAADRAVIAIAGWMGIALLAADGIRARQRLERLLRWLVVAGASLAALGMAQYTLGWDPVARLQFPGLRLNTDLNSIADRFTLKRVSGTADHAIEYGVVLAMIYPLALHFAMHPPPGHGRLRRWLPVAFMSVGMPISISRSAIVGLLAAMLILVPTWTWRRLLNAAFVGVAFLLAFRSLVPGVLGTIKALFLNLGVDPSITGRTEDYASIGQYFAERPLLGRGVGTFVPIQYFYVDNEYLMLLVQSGIIGLVAFLMLLLVGMSCGRAARRGSSDPGVRNLGQSLTASIFVALITYTTFDGLSFHMSAGVLFLILGCAGALWRMTREARADPAAART